MGKRHKLLYVNIRVFFLGSEVGYWLGSSRVFSNMRPRPLSPRICFSRRPPSTVAKFSVLALLQVHQEQEQPAEPSECFLALMRPQCTWSMSTVGLTAQEISFPIENPFLRGSHCHSMAQSKPTWSYPRELDK